MHPTLAAVAARAGEASISVSESLRLSDKAIMAHNLVHKKARVSKSIVFGTPEGQSKPLHVSGAGRRLSYM